MEAERVEQVESELDRSEAIEKRANERKDANRVEELWKDTARRHNGRRCRENGTAWYSYHMGLSEIHGTLAREHEERALSLLEAGGE